MSIQEKEVSASGRRAPRYKAVPPYEPEYSARDLLRVLRALVGDGKSRAPIQDLFSWRNPIFLKTGRQCLFVILKVMGFPRESRIGVPLYCCAAVFDAIVAAGHVPVFLDIDMGTYSISPESLSRHRRSLDAVVIIHLFGYPTDLEVVRDSLGDHAIPIIEDCAHALFSKCHGQFVGTQSDAAFFSFGPHKPAATGGGGVAVFSRSDFGSESSVFVSDSEQGIRGELFHTARCCARALLYERSIYSATRHLKFARFQYESKSDTEPRSVPGQFCVTRMRRCDESLLGERVRRFETKLPQLFRNAQHLRMALKDTSLSLPDEPVYGRWNHFFLPIRYRDAESRVRAVEYLATQNIDAVSLYQRCVRYAKGLGYRGNCPNAERAAATVAIVPHYTSLSLGEVDFIATAVRKSSEA